LELSNWTVTLVQQVSLAVGASKFHAVPHGTVLLAAHVSTGGVVSSTVTVWLHVLVLPHPSVNSQVRVMTQGQGPLLVTVLRTVAGTGAPLHASTALGVSKVQTLPHSTVLLVEQQHDTTVNCR
jgi:hypothetical protein